MDAAPAVVACKIHSEPLQVQVLPPTEKTSFTLGFAVKVIAIFCSLIKI
jgi:hypothetical protein